MTPSPTHKHALDALSRDVLRWQERRDNATGERIAQGVRGIVFTLCQKQAYGTVKSAFAAVDRADLESAAWQAVFTAAERYDPERRVKFSTFAAHHIKCALLEYWRDDGGRLIRHGRACPEQRPSVLPIDALVSDGYSRGQECLNWAEVFKDPNATDPEAFAADESSHNALWCLIEQSASKRELRVVRYRVDGITFKEISRLMGLSESRVYQLFTRVQQRVLRQKRKIKPWTGEA